MAVLISLPVLGGLIIVQTAILSQMPLLRGTADLVLLAVIAWALQKRVQTAWQWAVIGGLLVNIVSALPPGVPVLSYTLAVGLALLLRQRVWRAPILAMFVAVFFGALTSYALALGALRVVGDVIPALEAFNLIMLPGLLYNLVLAIPVYGLLGDLAKWLYPEELEV